MVVVGGGGGGGKAPIGWSAIGTSRASTGTAEVVLTLGYTTGSGGERGRLALSEPGTLSRRQTMAVW